MNQGGFTVTEDADTSANYERRAVGKSLGFAPCTAAILMNSTYSSLRGSLQFRNYYMNNVLLVGWISRLSDDEKYVTVCDGTTINGIEACVYEQDLDNGLLQSLLRDRVLARICLYPKNDSGSDVSYAIQSIIPLSDPNEITHHILDVIYSHVQLHKQNIGLDDGSPLKSTTKTSYHKNPIDSYQSMGILEAISSIAPGNESEHGISLQKVISELRNSFSEKEINEGIDHLVTNLILEKIGGSNFRRY